MTYIRKKIELICPECKGRYLKDESEYLRNTKIGRISYCSLACYGKNTYLMKNLDKYPKYDISKHSYHSDENTPFKYYMKLINLPKRNKFVDVSIQDLKDQWKLQKGICPYTNVSLILMTHTSPSLKNVPNPFHYASIDRIDTTKGYIKGNIEFISVGINFMKNRFDKEKVISFLKEISITPSLSA